MAISVPAVGTALHRLPVTSLAPSLQEVSLSVSGLPWWHWEGVVFNLLMLTIVSQGVGTGSMLCPADV